MIDLEVGRNVKSIEMSNNFLMIAYGIYYDVYKVNKYEIEN